MNRQMHGHRQIDRQPTDGQTNTDKYMNRRGSDNQIGKYVQTQTGRRTGANFMKLVSTEVC